MIYFEDLTIQKEFEIPETHNIYWGDKLVGAYSILQRQNVLALTGIYVYPKYRKRGLGTGVIRKLFRDGWKVIVLSPIHPRAHFWKQFKNTYDKKTGFMHLYP